MFICNVKLLNIPGTYAEIKITVCILYAGRRYVLYVSIYKIYKNLFLAAGALGVGELFNKSPFRDAN